MEQKMLEELQGLLCDINPVEISSHFADDTLFSWLGAWRSRAEMLVAFLLASEKSKIGEWINEDVDWICSNCNGDAMTEGDYRQVRSNYCPHCGAKMLLENEKSKSSKTD